jgi:hypothetical protein
MQLKVYYFSHIVDYENKFLPYLLYCMSIIIYGWLVAGNGHWHLGHPKRKAKYADQ